MMSQQIGRGGMGRAYSIAANEGVLALLMGMQEMEQASIARIFQSPIITYHIECVTL